MSGPAALTDYRLYISGHPIGITEAQLAARFSSFGTITKVDRLDQTDGNGDPSRYSFLTLRAESAKLQKCIALLSGSTWKGNMLRIAIAKPDYKERMAKERAAAEVEATKKPKKDKRKKQKELRGVDGKEGPNQALVDEQNVEGLPGWRKSADKKHLVYPITTRPSHPLPDAPADASKKRKNAKETDPDSIKPLSRAKRVKIDPVKWQPTHLKGEKAILSNVDAEPSTKQSKKATKAPKQPVKAISPTPSSSSEESEDSPDALSEHEVEELKESLDENLLASERTSQLALLNSLLAAQPKPVESVEPTLEPEEDSEMPTIAPEPIVEEPAQAPPVIQEKPKKKKKAKQVTIQEQLPGESAPIEGAPVEETQPEAIQPKKRKVILPAAVPQPESSTAWKAVQRYIPEEPTVEPEAVAVAEEVRMEDEEMQDDEATGEKNVNMTSLKDMFKPQEADQGFSLFDALAPFDLDADPFAEAGTEEPYAAPSRVKRPQAVPVKEAPKTTMFDQDEPLFFPLFLPRDEERLGLHLDDEQRARLEARSWTSGSGKRFRPLGTKQEREERHTERRGRLTEQIRKRHREAARKQKRRTGDA